MAVNAGILFFWMEIMSCVLGDTRPVIVASVLFISARFECGGGLEAKRAQFIFHLIG